MLSSSKPGSEAEGLATLFAPRSIAVLGASRSPKKISGRPIDILKVLGFDGPVYPINPVSDEIQGHLSYASVGDVPGPVDTAVISLPKDAVETAMTDCASKGVRNVVIFSSGFGEMGAQGKELENRLGAIARDHGMRVLGPNCMGAFDLHAKAGVTFADAPRRSVIRPGGLSIVSQSGAIASFIVVGAQERGIGVSKWIATGNEVDIDVAEVISFLATDPNTKIIAAYLEGCRDGKRLLSALEKARQDRKPVVLIKAGASESGAAAIASHTGALAGDNVVFEAAIRPTGAIRADSIDEMLDVAQICESLPSLPNGNRLAIASISGGAGILMADAAAGTDLTLPKLSAETAAKIRDLLPNASIGNPIDTTAAVIEDISRFASLIDILQASGEIDSIAAFLGTLGHNAQSAATLTETCASLAQKAPPVILSMRTSAQALNDFYKSGLPCIADPTRTVRAIDAVTQMSKAFAKHIPAQIELPVPVSPIAAPVNESDAKRFLSEYGVPMVAEAVATTPDEAAEAAAALGFPVVLKLLSANIAHKSDIGGVAVGLRNAEAVRQSFSSIMNAATCHAPQATIDGILVSPMISGIAEIILGTTRDPVFGPVLMIGMGGIMAEIYRDTVLSLAPVTESDAEAMLRRLRCFPILDGARGRPKADIDTIVSAATALSRAAAANADWVASIDVNPFIVAEAGKGGTAVDALLIPAP